MRYILDGNGYIMDRFKQSKSRARDPRFLDDMPLEGKTPFTTLSMSGNLHALCEPSGEAQAFGSRR